MPLAISQQGDKQMYYLTRTFVNGETGKIRIDLENAEITFSTNCDHCGKEIAFDEPTFYKYAGSNPDYAYSLIFCGEDCVAADKERNNNRT